MTSERGRAGWSIAAIWASALAGAIAIGIGVDRPRQLTVVTLLMLVLVLASGAWQLAIGRSDGFIRRMSLSTAGALAILAVASLVMAIAGAEGGVGIAVAALR